jgi:hypothetical protein
MTSLRLPSAQLAALSLEDVQLYVASQGWKSDPSLASSKALLYTVPDASDAELLIPKTKELGDYVNRMADVVQMLAAVEERSIWEVLNDISTPPADTIRLQITAPDATLGLLPLDDGIRLIVGGRGLLLAAACSAHHAQAHYPRQAFKESLEFLQSCQLGQTERGSFVATMMAPIPPQIGRRQGNLLESEPDVAIESEPFARKATLRLMSALGHINNSIADGKYDAILDGVPHGVSANLCDSIASMQSDREQAQLQIRMSWSRNRPRVPKSIASKVSFSRTAFQIIKEAGRKLREEPSIEKKRIEGSVITLKADTSLFTGFEGNVTLRTTVNGSTARVQVVLSRDEYAQACNAHRDANLVVVTGVLQREPKGYRLLDPQGFEVVPQTTAS